MGRFESNVCSTDRTLLNMFNHHFEANGMEYVTAMAFELCGVIVVCKDFITDLAGKVTLFLQSFVSQLVKVAHVKTSQRCRSKIFLRCRSKIFLRPVLKILVKGHTLESIIILHVSYNFAPHLIGSFIGEIAKDAGTWEAAMSQ